VLVASVSADALAAKFEATRIGPDGSIVLVHLPTHRAIARQPNYAATFGMELKDISPGGKIFQVNEEIFEAQSSIDGEVRIFVARKLQNLPLGITVGVSKASIRKELAQDLIGTLAVSLCFTGILWFGAVIIRQTHGSQMQAREALQGSEAKFRQFFDTTQEGIVLVGSNDRFIVFNRAFQLMSGYDTEELRASFVPALLSAYSRGMGTAFAGDAVMARAYNDEYEGKLTRKDGSECDVSVRTWLATDDATGPPGKMWIVFRDISERERTAGRLQASVAEKEVLLKEIYHRVKNNLQVVASLLAMQGRLAGVESRQVLQESANRVQAMAMVHEQLYRSGNLSSISSSEYLGQLIDHLRKSHHPASQRVPICCEVEDVALDIKTAIPLGLIINELISNAFKHAYAEGERGEIRVKLKCLEGGELELTVADDGRGLPAGFCVEKATSLGMQLVATLVAQLGGKLHRESGAGTKFRMAFRGASVNVARQRQLETADL